jgi:hypothetical protein
VKQQARSNVVRIVRESPYSRVQLALALVACFVVGMLAGRVWASESFYDKCGGGQVYIEDGSPNLLQAVGCAEIARRVRW